MKLTTFSFCITFIIANSLVFANGERTKDKMYERIVAVSACIRRMNGTHQVGCSSNRQGSTGVVHFVETEKDLEIMFNNGTAPPYVPVIPTALFDKSLVEKLIASNKVSGLVLYRQNDTKIEHFTHESTCPNSKSGLPGTCDVNWNPYGTDLLNMDVPFTIFYLEFDEDVPKLKNCFEKFNNFSFETQAERSLCALEIDAFMYATTDTPTCLRRSNSRTSLNPIKFCDPLGGDNVWTSLYPVKETKSSTKYIIITARLDTTSMFYGVMPGAASPVTGIVTLMATAQLLKKMLPMEEGYTKYEKNILFFLLNGETYDYMGSQRLLYDMEASIFPTNIEDSHDSSLLSIRPENISLFIELSQLSHKEAVYAHVLENTVEIASFIDKLKTNTKTAVFKPLVGVLPPASLQTFLKSYPNISGLVLADHQEAYLNNFYNSIYDNASNIQFQYYENVTTEDDASVIPEDSLQMYLANVSEMVALSVYQEVTNATYAGTQKPSLAMINELLHCYLESANCKVHEAIQKKKLPDVPYNLYVGVYPRGRNFVTNLMGLTLAWLTGDIVANTNTTCLNEHRNYTFRFINMSKSLDDLNTTVCFRTTLNLTDAVSPAFIIKDYDWSSGKYSSWTESSWYDIGARIFLKPSAAHENMTIAIGSMALILSMALVYFVKSRSHILFALAEVSEPTDC